MNEAGVRAFVKRRNRAWRRQLWPSLLMLDAIFAGLAYMSEHDRLHGPWVRPWFGVSLMGLLIAFNLVAVGATLRTFQKPRNTAVSLVAHADRTALSALILGVLLFVVLFDAGMLWGGTGPRGVDVSRWRTYSAETIVEFGLGLFLMGLISFRVRELFDRRPVVIVDESGFFDRRFTRRPVKWGEIDRLLIKSAISWPVMTATDGASNRTFMSRVYSWLGYPYLYVGLGGVDRSPGDILLAIDRFAPHITANLGA